MEPAFAMFIFLSFIVLLIYSMISINNEDQAKQLTKQREIKMKEQEFQLNQARRKAEASYEETLVKLENEYGVEEIPYGNLEKDETNLEVRIDGFVVKGIQDIRARVEEARKMYEEILPTSEVSTKISVKIMNNIAHFIFDNEDQGVEQIELTGTMAQQKELLQEAMVIVDDEIINSYKQYMKFIDKPKGFAMISQKAAQELDIAKECLEAFKHNRRAKETYQKTGEYVDFIKADYKWDNFREVNDAIAQATKVRDMFMQRAIKLGYNVEPIKVGETYIKNIAGNQKTSHPQRTAALRCGLLLSSPITFTVMEETDVKNNYIVSVLTTHGQKEMIATLEVDDSGADFYIKTFMSLNFKEYFEKHEFLDELYQDDPEMELTELIKLELWK